MWSLEAKAHESFHPFKIICVLYMINSYMYKHVQQHVTHLDLMELHVHVYHWGVWLRQHIVGTQPLTRDIGTHYQSKQQTQQNPLMGWGEGETRDTICDLPVSTTGGPLVACDTDWILALSKSETPCPPSCGVVWSAYGARLTMSCWQLTRVLVRRVAVVSQDGGR